MSGDGQELVSELVGARERLAALEASDAPPEEIEAAREWVTFLECEHERRGPGSFETCLADHAERAAAETAQRRSRTGPLDRVRRLL